MRKILIIIAIVFSVIGLLFTILPMGTIALIPILIGVACSAVAMFKSEAGQKSFPKWVLIVSAVLLVVVVAKEVFVKDEVKVDAQFQQEIETSKQEAQQELEGLE